MTLTVEAAQLVADILTAPKGTRFEDDLFKADGGWTAERAALPAIRILRESDPARATRLLGPQEIAVLTADGRPVNPLAYCMCRIDELADPELTIFFTRWTMAGLASYGFAHVSPSCRRLVRPGVTRKEMARLQAEYRRGECPWCEEMTALYPEPANPEVTRWAPHRHPIRWPAWCPGSDELTTSSPGSAPDDDAGE